MGEDATMPAMIRRAGCQDLEVLYALLNLAYAKERWLLPGPRIMKQELAEELEDEDNLFLLAASRRHIIGSIRLRFRASPVETTPWPFFGLFAVHPEVRGIGLGKRLVTTVEDVARESKEERLHLHCARELGLCAYYESLGYLVMEERFGVHGRATRPFSLVTMVKDLTLPRKVQRRATATITE